MPKPLLLKTIDISKAGLRNKMLIGDLDGDGRRELLMVQGDGGIDDRYIPHQVVCLTAFSLDGELLWQVGVPHPEPGRHGSDFPAQIYDIDGDGFNEVLCVMDKQFLVIDGKTGTIKQSYPLPDPYAHDCIIIANLTGHAYPRDIILKNRYRQMWAMDQEFQLLWTYKGNIGHYPWVYDFNNDGNDEVIAGFDYLDSNGCKLWSSTLADHADCIWVGPVLDGKTTPYLVIGGSSTAMYDQHGTEIWRYDKCRESQHVALGRFRPDLPGLQVAGVDRIDRSRTGKDGIFLLNSMGKELAKENRQTIGWATIIDTLTDWDDNEQDYILAFRRGRDVLPGIYDGYLNKIVEFPVQGLAVHGKLVEQGSECVIIYNQEHAHIYAGKWHDLSETSGKPLPQDKRLYNSTLYPGGEYVTTIG